MTDRSVMITAPARRLSRRGGGGLVGGAGATRPEGRVAPAPPTPRPSSRPRFSVASAPAPAYDDPISRSCVFGDLFGGRSMLDFQANKGPRTCSGLSRRDFLKAGSLGAGALSLSLAELNQAEAANKKSDVNCILLFLVGAPSQL